MNYGNRALRNLYFSLPYPLKSVLSSTYGLVQRNRRQGKAFSDCLAFLDRSQWLSNDELARLQLEQVRKFLAFCCHHSRFYADLFRKIGFDPSGLRAIEDLRRLPLLTKEVLRDNVGAIVPDTLKRLRPIWTHTSGTTGSGLKFPESLECFQREYAFRVQSYCWGGTGLGERWAFCAGHPVASPDRDRPPFWILDLANNMLLMSSYHLSEKNLPSYIEALQKYKPSLLSGYPSSIFLLARANELLGCPVSVPSIVTSSETLFDHQRETIQHSFGGRVSSYYGNAERAAVISQCERGTYHLRMEHSLVELLNEKGDPCKDGEEGQLACTAFGNYATPLVRYLIGDVAVFSRTARCECGRGGIIVEKIIGRTEDYIVTPDGRYIGRLDHLFKNATLVRMAQIVQDAPEAVTINVVREQGFCKANEAEILQEARLRLGPSISIRFRYVDDIPRTASGKFQFIVSNLARYPGNSIGRFHQN